MNDETVDRLLAGGDAVVAEIFSEFQPRLERMVEFRLDRRLRGRVDSSDVIQEAYIEIARRIADYTSSPTVAFYVWVRQITWQTLVSVHRRHLGQKRHPKMEVRIALRDANDTTFSIAQALVAQLTSPSGVAQRNEDYDQLREALASMDDTDREVLALRHFEQLGNNEVSEILGISRTAASNRYVRAIKRLGDVLDSLPDFQERNS
ncbi:MAG: sigma-70 family RNA polymerase sigma factor [Planctomycetota bacterium]|nr:sigma-70 family RNA polymerase sigma factor [Planctomycetota bacterium]